MDILTKLEHSIEKDVSLANIEVFTEARYEIHRLRTVSYTHLTLPTILLV